MIACDLSRASTVSLAKIKQEQKIMEENLKLKEEKEAVKEENQTLLHQCEELKSKVEKLNCELEVWLKEGFRILCLCSLLSKSY